MSSNEPTDVHGHNASTTSDDSQVPAGRARVEEMEVDDQRLQTKTELPNGVEGSDRSQPIQPSVDSPGFQTLTRDLNSSLDVLLEGIAATVAVATEMDSCSTDDVTYFRLHQIAVAAHERLAHFGSDIETGQIIPGTNDIERGDIVAIKDGEWREKLRGIGRSLWMAVRSHPDVFRDNASGGGKPKSPKEDEEEKHRGAASGFVRLIAAKLVLIDHIGTKNKAFPGLILKTPSPSDGAADSSPRPLSSASPNELEFGLKSFSRAGRAIHLYGSNPKDAYGTLLLAANCWEALNSSAAHERGEHLADASSATSIASKNLEEAFDGMALLPDAAEAALESRTDIGVLEVPMVDGEAMETTNGTPTCSHILSELKRLDEFVKRYCCHAPKQADSSLALSTMQRYLPSVARVGYKHGNHFARLRNYSDARGALEIALKATNQCLAGIRARDDDSSRVVVCQALQIQEQDLLVVSKQCLYVLSHVSQETQKTGDAHVCLDQIEKYIDEQRKRGDEQYAETMKNLIGRDGEKSFSSSFTSSDLALEGPKKQDKADIQARVQTARARERHTELKEKANLAFSRIMLYHRKPQAPNAEEEKLIDAQCKGLFDLAVKFVGSTSDGPSSTNISQGGLVINGSKKQILDGGDEVFELALNAAREIRVRRLVASNGGKDAPESNPYDTLLSKCSKGHPKHLFIILDHLTAILVAIQTLREKSTQDESHSLTELDELALAIAKEYFHEFNALSSSFSTEKRTDSTLFSGSNAAKELTIALSRESLKQFSRALALYRSSDSHHGTCAQWADYVIDVAELLRRDEGSANSSTSRHYYQVQQASDEVLAEVMAVKAYSLSMGGSYTSGLRSARSAWELSEKAAKPSIHSLIVLFSCACRKELKGAANSDGNLASSSDALLELDNALSCFLSADKVSSSTGSMADEVLQAFPMLGNACVNSERDNGELLFLGVLERWIKLFTKNESIIQALRQENKRGTRADVPGGAALLTTLESYLGYFEKTICCGTGLLGSKNTPEVDTLENTLESVLSLIRIVRDRKPKKRSGSDRPTSPSQYTLIWDDEVTKVMVGDCSDCIRIAEALWNIANLLMNSSNGSAAPLWTAANLFARAHDFALVSEEEEGAALSDGFLDCDNRHISDMLLPDFSSDSQDSLASDLSSEFSARCLLNSAALALDDTTAPKETMKGRARKSLHRLALAHAEFETNSMNDVNQHQYIQGLLAYLTLRCLVVLGNDELGLDALANGSLMNSLPSKSLNRKASLSESSGEMSDSDSSSESRISPGQSSDGVSMLDNLFLMARRAETNSMPETAKHLLRFCVRHLTECRSHENSGSEDSSHALGAIQRKLIELGSMVSETIAVFEDVDSEVKNHNAHAMDTSSGSESACPPYSTEELDWFAIEGYNRGCNLVSLGDIANAAKLVAIALNLVPFCSKAVESYRSEMMQTLRTAMERNGRKNSVLCGHIIDLGLPVISDESDG